MSRHPGFHSLHEETAASLAVEGGFATVETTLRSRLLVLDGETFEERARATLPHTLPFDFHGRYVPELRAKRAG